MPSFHNGAVEIAYLDEGEGDPIVLVHGFASSKNVNWVYPTWVSDLRKDGRRVIALDNRGHGRSEKLYDAKDYLQFAPHEALVPGTMIFLAVLSINYIGDGLRDALDPRKVLGGK